MLACRLRILLAFAGGLALSSPSLAGTIQMQVTTQTEVTPEAAKLTVIIANQGDDAALRVAPHLLVGETGRALQTLPRLAPGESQTLSDELRPNPFQKGVYHIPLYVDYEDANGWPLQATHIIEIRNPKGVAPSGLAAKIAPQTLVDETRATLTLYNSHNARRTLAVQKVVPSALLLSEFPDEVAIGPTEKLTLPLLLVNKNALPPSHYRITIVLADQDSDQHYSEAIPIDVDVREGSVPRRTLLMGVLAALIFGAAAVVVYSRLSKRS